MPKTKILIGSDHAGFELKQKLIQHFPQVEWEDAGTHSKDSVDYPDYGKKVAEQVHSGQVPFGILICGSGIGMSIIANRFSNVRAALVWTPELAKLSKEHNHANLLCLPSRFVSEKEAFSIVEAWIQTPVSDDERHLRRVKKLNSDP